MSEEILGKHQRRVMNPDGRVSIVGAPIWNNPKNMAKHRLTLVDAKTPITGNITPVSVNAPKNREMEANLMAQLGVDKDGKPTKGTDEPIEVEMPEMDLTIAPDEPVKPNKTRK